jgi:hypothetical protein
MKLSLDNAFVDSVPLDVVPDPFLFDLNWSAQALIDAVSGRLSPLQHFALACSANDAAVHRPRLRPSFLALPPLNSRFRIGG